MDDKIVQGQLIGYLKENIGVLWETMHYANLAHRLDILIFRFNVFDLGVKSEIVGDSFGFIFGCRATIQVASCHL